MKAASYLNFRLIIINEIIMKPMIDRLIKISDIFSTKAAVENIYLHLPFCRKKCHFCAFPVQAVGFNSQSTLLPQYVSNLKEQIALSRPFINTVNPLKSIYLGGGTPSLHSKSQIKSLLLEFSPSNSTQITVQVNPAQMSSIQDLLDVGVNRISLGVQSFNIQTLNRMGRYAEKNTKQVILEELSKCRPQNLNVDFILNFCSNEEDWKQMTDFIVSVLPQHLTIYFLEVNEGSKIYSSPEIISQLPKEQEIISKYIDLCYFLSKLGYQHYEVSNFSRGTKHRSTHSSTYWQGDKQYLAYGMGATSLTSQRRITRPRTISKYLEYVKQLRTGVVSSSLLQIAYEDSAKQKLASVIMSGIRTSQGIWWGKIEDIIDSDQAIERMVNCIIQINEQRPGMINYDNIGDKISLNSPLGFLLGDQIGFRLIESLQDKNNL